MRQVFFGFSWDNVSRVMRVRDVAVAKGCPYTAHFIDAAGVEALKRQSREEIMRSVEEQVDAAEVVCVLISKDTNQSEMVAHLIERTIEQDKGLFGVYVHNIKDAVGNKGVKGANPLPQGYPSYDWVGEEGDRNLASWIEDAFEHAGTGPPSFFTVWMKKIFG